MPAYLGVVEWVNELEAVDGVLVVVGCLVVHGSLDHVEAKLPVLLELEIPESRLLVKQGYDHGRSLDLTRYLLVVEGTVFDHVQKLVHLSCQNGELNEKIGLVAGQVHGVGLFDLLLQILRVD